MQRRDLAKLILPLLLVVGGYALCRRSGTQGDSAVATSAVGGPTTSWGPLLSGLKQGDTIGEWTVQNLSFNKAPNGAPQLEIVFERKRSFVSVYVGRRENTVGAPIETQRYAVSHGHLDPQGEPIPEGASGQLAEKIAERIRANEATASAIPELQ
ncbi:MAG: hypothetical protein HYV09_22030 [Deltaproteobacteria bacterium]|nr:hypothetical protein [Deltaproteobacteria bacterium]